MTNEPYADVSEMYMAHTMFRREFGLLPGLIDGVSAADAGRARVITQHFRLIQAVLLHHHHAEDQALWPRLEQRAGHPGEVVVAAMESQHGEIDKVINDLRDGLETWQETADRPGSFETIPSQDRRHEGPAPLICQAYVWHPSLAELMPPLRFPPVMRLAALNAAT